VGSAQTQNKHRHPFLEWDSNPQPQRSSGRRPGGLCDRLRNLYSSPNTIKMIKSRTMRWTEHVARMAKERNAYRIHIKIKQIDWMRLCGLD
jgi:hypothetical protein